MKTPLERLENIGGVTRNGRFDILLDAAHITRP
jgi:hypothetical protein